ncbi:hypothetical protein [Oerskovia rustica]|uniref:YD repeat-containing protein n=1 Tax=Oerskovia rustica TaxID=2762237 RepID=A0ABR8RX64_9CELL|nr:hypothetical protein [Oerskovia rustica]MBD7952374.1 hypothetical protein [Oerskovia rustica]
MNNGIPEELLGTSARIERAIAAKQAQRPRVDHNGYPIDGDQPVYQYDNRGRLISVNGLPAVPN